jgi:CheY-like chemotaxis protein
MSGTTFTSALRANAATRGLPILMITTSINTADRRAAVRAGCDRFIILPCLPDQLTQELQQLLG